jgi:molybdopterin/thiamine biosynthesis adenylyltransferase
LRNRYPNVSVETRNERLTADNALEWFQQADFVIDACDDPATKFLINAVAISTQTPFVYGGVLRTGGSTMTVLPGKSACLACVFPQASQASEDLGCDRAGILAPVAGVIGTRQALAALACLSADSRTNGGVLTAYELRGRRWRALRFDRVSDCRVCGQPRTSAPTPRRVQPCLS